MSSDAECRIFRYSVYDVQPSAITCMRYSEAKRCLAVARANGAIELWRHYEVHFRSHLSGPYVN